MWTIILSALKNKFVIYGAIALCCVLLVGGLWLRGNHYQSKYDNLIAQQNAEKVKIYEAFRKEADLHNARLVEIEKVSNDINKRIKGLKLEKEICQSPDYYRMANDIIGRLQQNGGDSKADLRQADN